MNVTRNIKNGKQKVGRWPADYISTTWSAKKLGVTREHLSRVLHGRRQSWSLTGRYKTLIKEETARREKLAA